MILSCIEGIQLLYFVFPRDDAVPWDTSLVGYVRECCTACKAFCFLFLNFVRVCLLRWVSTLCEILSFAWVQNLASVGVIGLLALVLVTVVSTAVLAYLNLSFLLREY